VNEYELKGVPFIVSMKSKRPITNNSFDTALTEHVQLQQNKLTKGIKQEQSLPITIVRKKSQEYFYTIKNKKESDDFGLGKFLLRFELTARAETLYIPISIASGRKSAGFIYHIEGTAEGASTATITCKGNDIVTVTSGSISYSKIPAGKTALFTIMAEVTGVEGKFYKIVLSRINYKINPNDLRYKRFLTEIASTELRFR
jgi:hypothetical protein